MELYNIRHDPSESSNEFRQEPKLASRLLKMLEASEARDNETVIGDPSL